MPIIPSYATGMVSISHWPEIKILKRPKKGYENCFQFETIIVGRKASKIQTFLFTTHTVAMLL